MKVALATRGSELALWQASHVARQITMIDPSVTVDLVIVRTTGDRIGDVPLASIGEVGLFTKEVDRAVLEGRATAAVHSLKDLPAGDVEGLRLTAILQRADARDAFLPAPGRPRTLHDLAAGATVGTSSLRRRALLHAHRPDLVVEDLRGNLDSRLDRLRHGEYDGALLAVAGVLRLGREDAIGQVLDPPGWLPAAGQGALAIVTANNSPAATLIRQLDHAQTRAEVTAERAFLHRLQGGCQIPIGALATTTADGLRLHGFVASIDGRHVVRGDATGLPADAAALGAGLAADLARRGADEIVTAARRSSPEVLPGASAP